MTSPSCADADLPLARRKTLRRVLFVVGILEVVMLLAFFAVWLYSKSPAGRAVIAGAHKVRTQAELAAIAAALQQFHKSLDRFPTNLAELPRNDANQIFLIHDLQDVWKRPYIYQRPTRNTPGKVGTYGADGDPTGDKSDGDLFREIPVYFGL